MLKLDSVSDTLFRSPTEKEIPLDPSAYNAISYFYRNH